jgi:ADP-glucose pyrophosphorylase
VIEDSHIHDCMILDNVRIRNCTIRNCVIDDNCVLEGIDLKEKMIRAGTKLVVQ